MRSDNGGKEKTKGLKKFGRSSLNDADREFSFKTDSLISIFVSKV